MQIPAPRTEAELLNRAAALAGKSLWQLAETRQVPVPARQKQAKGWIGALMENCLGATGSSLPVPDFREIQVELKTLPINHLGKPRESTYVCTVPLTREAITSWDHSVVRLKLTRVLWIPVEADPSIPLPRRRVGKAFIWSPDPDEEQQLRADWEELTEMICLGELDYINARFGEVLQIRPKAANARARTRACTDEGEWGTTVPRGFYLRPTFTYRILQRHSGC